MGWTSMIFGGYDKASSRRLQQENLEEAGTLIEESKTAWADNRDQIHAQFKDRLSTARAKMGASGFTMGSGAWESIYGGLVRGRDEALGKLQTEEADFREGAAYQVVKEDFEATGLELSINANQGKKPSDYDPDIEYSVNVKSPTSGKSYLTEEQQGMLLTSKTGGASFRGYVDDLKPSFEEYEKFRFGSDEEKAAFSDSMTTRIEASNIKLIKADIGEQVAAAANNPLYKGGDYGGGMTFTPTPISHKTDADGNPEFITVPSPKGKPSDYDPVQVKNPAYKTPAYLTPAPIVAPAPTAAPVAPWDQSTRPPVKVAPVPKRIGKPSDYDPIPTYVPSRPKHRQTSK